MSLQISLYIDGWRNVAILFIVLFVLLLVLVLIAVLRVAFILNIIRQPRKHADQDVKMTNLWESPQSSNDR